MKIMKFVLFVFIAIGLFGVATLSVPAPTVFAANPSLSLSSAGSGDSVVVTVSGGAPNSAVSLYYAATAGGNMSRSLGMTDSSGAFWTSISTGQIGVAANSSVYVTVGSDTSLSRVWPYSVTTTTTTTGLISLNQTSVVMAPGQSRTVNVSNEGGNTLYISNNSNGSVANASISGTQITINGHVAGSSVVTVCMQGTTNNCASLYVNVTSNNGVQPINLSQTNLSVGQYQNATVNITGGTGYYSVVNNSNSSVLGATLNGSTVTVFGNGSSGVATITICSTDMSSCGIINATIGANSSSGITFSQTNPSMSLGQTLSITASGGTGGYYLSNNTNTAVVQTTLLTTGVSLYAKGSGTASVTICANSGGCGTFTVTVTGGGDGGPLTLGQSTMNVLVGQTLSMVVSGGTLPYSALTNNSGVAQVSVNGNVVNVTGVATGKVSVPICSAAGGCKDLSITVNASTNSLPITFSPSSLSMTAGQSSTVTITGNGGYYVSSGGQNVATVSISGSIATVNALSAGTANVSICQTSGQCATLMITVSGSLNTNGTMLLFNPVIGVGQTVILGMTGGNGSYYISTNNTTYFNALVSGTTLTITGRAQGVGTLTLCSTNGVCSSMIITVNNVTTGGTNTGSTNTNTNTGSTNTNTGTPVTVKYKFYNPLSVGSEGTDVTELQKRLIVEGVYSGPVTGYYGAATVAAVKAYQKKNGLDQLGNVGPGTRSMLNR